MTNDIFLLDYLWKYDILLSVKFSVVSSFLIRPDSTAFTYLGIS